MSSLLQPHTVYTNHCFLCNNDHSCLQNAGKNINDLCYRALKSTSPPQRVHRHPSRQRMHSSAAPSWQRMHSFAVYCAMPTTDKSNHSAAGTLHSHCSATFFLYVTLRCLTSLQKKKFAPSLTGDINPQSSNWNNKKMKIAYNSA